MHWAWAYLFSVSFLPLILMPVQIIRANLISSLNHYDLVYSVSLAWQTPMFPTITFTISIFFFLPHSLALILSSALASTMPLKSSSALSISHSSPLPPSLLSPSIVRHLPIGGQSCDWWEKTTVQKSNHIAACMEMHNVVSLFAFAYCCFIHIVIMLKVWTT